MSIPLPFRRLVDDAAIFPPGLAPLPEAVRAHRAHPTSAYADLVGPLVVDTARLDDLAALDTAGIAVSVVVPTPAEVPGIAARAADAGVVLAGLEVRLGGSGRPAEQVAAVAADAPDGIPTYVEVPRPADPAWGDALAAATEHGLRLKLRTGGTEAGAFPSEDEVATWIAAAVTNALPFKCTAGLHNAVRHTAPGTGFEHHGYLNILLATARAGAGAEHPALVATLAERDAATLADAARTTVDLGAARASFVSFGSCSVAEPYDDLVALGLLATTPSAPEEHRS
ncbi:hypothetical protein KVF89_09630 [Nocardioides carbamazepini]|uniref:hypothetical protein n=1 Tax=Nocardioides carbamazepini TaxID=2854259 RepID=UPI00214A6819|nr:hypothetical protein [Nocardioides carbamazepini]MCR1782793.1 hypothetical protein [Nocardioides carbamazepini]